MGHSWGTLVALEIALRFPERVRGLVLISGYYFPTARVDSLILGIPAIPVVKPEGKSSRLAQTLPHSRFEAIPHAGHMVHHSHASIVVNAVNRTAQETVTRSATSPAGKR